MRAEKPTGLHCVSSRSLEGDRLLVLAASGRMRELGREIADGLRIDIALVPLLDHSEIRAAGLPILAAVPTVAGEEVCRRGQHIGRAAQEIAAAIAVEVDREFDIGR